MSFTYSPSPENTCLHVEQRAFYNRRYTQPDTRHCPLHCASAGTVLSEVFQLAHQLSREALSSPKEEAAVGFYLVLLYLSHITGEKFTSFPFFLVYSKIGNISF